MTVRIFPITFFKRKSVNETPRWELWFRGLVKVASFLNVLPFEYNRSADLYTATKSRFRTFLWYFLLVTALTDLICLQIALRGIRLVNVGAQEYVDFYLHYFSRASGFMLVWGLARRHNDCVEGLNIMFSNCKVWNITQNEFGESFGGPIQNSLKRTVKYTTIYIFLQPLVGLSVHLENRKSKRYWISQLLLRSGYDTTPGVVCSSIIDFYLSLMMMIPSATTVMAVASHGSVLLFFSTTLSTRFRSRPYDWKNGYRTYRSIQTMLKIMEPTFCHHLAPIVMYVCFWDLVLCICGLITRFQTFPLPVLIDFTICILMLYLLLKQIICVGGNLLEKGEEFKDIARLWLNSSYQGKLRRKQVASCASLKIHTGSHFYMKRSTFMVYMKLVFERSIDAILTVFEKT